MATRVLSQGGLLNCRSWSKPLLMLYPRAVSSGSVRLFSEKKYDVAIVGGGIIGLATAQELIRRWPNLSYILLEKETTLAAHQTGHNSGVIHAGIYYAPGSLKAKLCVEGLNLTYKYCDENRIPYKRCGKLIVAVQPDQMMKLQDLYERGVVNGVKGLHLLMPKDFKEIEPHCKGIAALHSPNTGIVDWGLVARTYAKHFEKRGGMIVTGYEVTDFKYNSSADASERDHPVVIEGTNQVAVSCRYVVTCGGLFSDRLAKLSGCSSEPRIVPFRGDYLVVNPEKAHLVKGNIYPVPDPRFPFLGVHFTPRMDGSVWLGPNAILAFKREGYSFFDFSLKDTVDALGYRGLQRLLKKYWKFGAKEVYKGFLIRETMKDAQQFIPEITASDVKRGPSGVRAQALDKDGNLVDDFIFDSGVGAIGQRCLHVRNAPSPAATSSLAIASMVADKIASTFKL